MLAHSGQFSLHEPHMRPTTQMINIVTVSCGNFRQERLVRDHSARVVGWHHRHRHHHPPSSSHRLHHQHPCASDVLGLVTWDFAWLSLCYQEHLSRELISMLRTAHHLHQEFHFTFKP